MTQREIELRILNLEKNLSALASKQYSRDSDNENKIQNTDVELNITKTDLSLTDDKLEDYSAELLFQICLLELGLDEEDLEEDEE